MNTTSHSPGAQACGMRKLMTLAEVASVLDLAPATVHRLPLPSIRLGRQLRFDPKDVERLIESSKEAV